jgi:hypothetical protein
MKKIISTLSELYKHPRNVVDSFLSRRNGVYSHPFIFMAGISLFVTAVLMVSDLLFLDLPDAINTGSENETVAQIQLWVETVSRVVSTIFLPLTSVVLLIPALSVSGLIFFRNELNGFYDNLILSSYIVTGAGLFSLLWVPVLWLNPEVIVDNSMRFTISTAILGLPILWLYHKYFQKNTPISIIRQLSTAASGFVLFIVLSGFASGILGYMIFAIRRIVELAGQG